MKTEWPSLWIPHVYNQEGQTPLKIAHMHRHRRVIGWLLELLRDYPFGYCQYQVSSMIFDIIGEGFESQVGQYLDCRFKTQKWTTPYQTGRLLISESSGINQTTITNWPSRTSNFEEKFFRPECTQVPVHMKVLDCPNLHQLSGQDLQKLLLSMTRSDIAIFSHKSIQALIEYTWERTRCVIVGWLFLPFLGYLVTYMIFLEILFSTDPAEDSALRQHLKAYTMSTQAILLAFAIYFI